MNFYNRFLTLCNEKKVSPSRALINAGLSKSLANKWSKNPDVAPSGPTLIKLASYFHVELNQLVPTAKVMVTGIEYDDDPIEGIKKEPIRLDGLSKVQIETYEMLEQLSSEDFEHVHDFCAGLLASKSHD